jgi:hypothetical protein
MRIEPCVVEVAVNRVETRKVAHPETKERLLFVKRNFMKHV